MGCPKCNRDKHFARYTCARSVMDQYNVSASAKLAIYGIAAFFGLFALALFLGYV